MGVLEHDVVGDGGLKTEGIRLTQAFTGAAAYEHADGNPRNLAKEILATGEPINVEQLRGLDDQGIGQLETQLRGVNAKQLSAAEKVAGFTDEGRIAKSADTPDEKAEAVAKYADRMGIKDPEMLETLESLARGGISKDEALESLQERHDEIRTDVIEPALEELRNPTPVDDPEAKVTPAVLAT